MIYEHVLNGKFFLYVVPQLLEFDILIQYYGKLRDQMRLIGANKLRDWFVNAEITDVGIYTHAFMMYEPEEKILIKVASRLLSGETHVLYLMFETLQNHSDLFHDLVSEIQVELDQKLQTGTLYTYMKIHVIWHVCIPVC